MVNIFRLGCYRDIVISKQLEKEKRMEMSEELYSLIYISHDMASNCCNKRHLVLTLPIVDKDCLCNDGHFIGILSRHITHKLYWDL